MNKVDIIKKHLPEINIEDKEYSISLLSPWRTRKEIYLLETAEQKKIVKFFKRNLLELFKKEIAFRYWKILQHAPQLLYYNIKLEHTKPNQPIQWDDFMFFVEEFIHGKTLNQILNESKMITQDIIFINKAVETYNKVFDSTYSNNFILKNANPNNIIFQENNIHKPHIVDRTAMKDTNWHLKEILKDEYDTMLTKNIHNIALKYLKW